LNNANTPLAVALLTVGEDLPGGHVHRVEEIGGVAAA
jgi:hypothetical protein